MNQFSIADFIVIAIIMLFVYIFYKKGAVKAIFGFLSSIVSIFAAKLLYPVVSIFLMDSALFDNIKNAVFKYISENTLNAETLKTQTDAINNLGFPDFIVKALIENNNSEIYNILDASGIGDYIAKFIAGILINIISWLIVFVIVFLAIRLVGRALNIIKKLPVIHTADKLLGAVLGCAQAVFLIWILMALATLFYAKPENREFIDSISSSPISGWFYENNLILNMITDIIK